MLSHTEQEVLENICRGSGAALLDIHSIISKVYDDELAYDLNRHAAKYSRSRARAAEGLLDQGIVPQPISILDRTKRWTAIQAGTALNVSTGHVADMMLKEENKRVKGMEDTLGKNKVTSTFSCELAEEFLEFEKENIQILKSYL